MRERSRTTLKTGGKVISEGRKGFKSDSLDQQRAEWVMQSREEFQWGPNGRRMGGGPGEVKYEKEYVNIGGVWGISGVLRG